MIAVLSGVGDFHAIRVSQELEARGHSALIVDTQQFGSGATIHYPIDGGAEIRRADGATLAMDEVRAVWNRRPLPAIIDDAVSDPDDRRFCRQEWAQTLDGLLMNLEARFVNSVHAEFGAVKPRQLRVARDAGLNVPDTLITSDPDQVGGFLDKHGGHVIHKAITAPRHRLLETRMWAETDSEALEDLPLAPTMFQEAVDGPSDVRATVAGERILAARIQSSEGRFGVDSRLDLDVPCVPHELPARVANPLLEMMSALGLVYGTIDLKITDEGEYFFFEVNPQGQFLYIEILTGLPITSAVADLLAA